MLVSGRVILCTSLDSLSKKSDPQDSRFTDPDKNLSIVKREESQLTFLLFTGSVGIRSHSIFDGLFFIKSSTFQSRKKIKWWCGSLGLPDKNPQVTKKNSNWFQLFRVREFWFPSLHFLFGLTECPALKVFAPTNPLTGLRWKRHPYFRWFQTWPKSNFCAQKVGRMGSPLLNCRFLTIGLLPDLDILGFAWNIPRSRNSPMSWSCFFVFVRQLHTTGVWILHFDEGHVSRQFKLATSIGSGVSERSKRATTRTTSRWWFQIFFYFYLYLGKIPILTIIFFNWVEINHQRNDFHSPHLHLKLQIYSHIGHLWG